MIGHAEGLIMAKETSKRTTSASRAAGIQAALEKIAASGLMQSLAQEKSEGAYEAEKAMEHGNFARPHFTKVSGAYEILLDNETRSYIRAGSMDAKTYKNSPLLVHIAELRSLSASIQKGAASSLTRLAARDLHDSELRSTEFFQRAFEEISGKVNVFSTEDSECELPLPLYVSFDKSDEHSHYAEVLGDEDIVRANDVNYYAIIYGRESDRRRKR